MKRNRFAAIASLAALLCLTLQCYASAQDSNAIKHDSQSQAQQDSKQSQSHDNQQAATEEDEIEYRGMEHAALGVMLSERQGKGVRIRDILPDSPADQAGLRPGDRIMKLDNTPVNSYYEVIRFVNHVQPGQTSNITVQRGDEEKNLRVTFATRDQVYGQGQQFQVSGNERMQRQGRNTFAQQGGNQYQDNENMDNQGRFAQRSTRQNRWNYRTQQQGERGILGIDLANERGAAVIEGVRPGSPAQSAGLRRGDEIVSINGQNVQDANDVIEDLQDRQPGERISITVYQNGQQRNLRARLTSEQDLMRQASRERNQFRNDGQRSFRDGSREQDQNDDRYENDDQR